MPNPTQNPVQNPVQNPGERFCAGFCAVPCPNSYVAHVGTKHRHHRRRPGSQACILAIQSSLQPVAPCETLRIYKEAEVEASCERSPCEVVPFGCLNGRSPDTMTDQARMGQCTWVFWHSVAQMGPGIFGDVCTPVRHCPPPLEDQRYRNDIKSMRSRALAPRAGDAFAAFTRSGRQCQTPCQEHRLPEML